MPTGETRSPAGDPLIGRVLCERYRVARKIGEGAMGTVYEAEHALIGKRIALKILHADLARQADVAGRFLQEAKAASRIGHENVIDISDFGQSPEGLVYVAMEYLDGQDLGRLLKAERHLPWARARPILMQITKALRAAHEHGIIHRDMKPENVFVIKRLGQGPADARPDLVKVMDFGIAKVARPQPAGGAAGAGGVAAALAGTPAYMSPEQAAGRRLDQRSDVYAVGCLMYQILTGSVPFSGASAEEVLAKQASEPAPSLRRRRPELDIPAGVEAVALRALNKDRELRWEDMDAFYRALGSAGGEPFETSGVYVRNPSLQFPAVVETGAVARISSNDLPQPAPAGEGDAADEQDPPVVRRRAGVKLGVVFLGVAAAAVLVLTAVRLVTRAGARAATPAGAPAQP